MKNRPIATILLFFAVACGSFYLGRSTAPVASDPVNLPSRSFDSILTIEPKSAPTAKNIPSSTKTPSVKNAASLAERPTDSKTQYILNRKTKKFHKPSCSSVKQMNEGNKIYSTKSREEIISDGYDPCGRCHP